MSTVDVSNRTGWYMRRLRRMSPREMAGRVGDQLRYRAWARRQVLPATPVRPPAGGTRRFDAILPETALGRVPASAKDDVRTCADEILAGRWDLFGVTREDMDAPDWFYDPLTGRRAPQEQYCFRVNYRSEELTGNVKQLWELSRMHHVTVLAAAFALTGESLYAEAAARHLRSWWAANPFLSGVHWTSGIEVGLRLITWVWTRRLLEGWMDAPALFEQNDDAAVQIWWHQRYLAAFRSRGSSANNHVIAEASGQLVSSLAFPWFVESEGWARQAANLLERELAANTFPSGVNREQAFDYHGLVAELVTVAAVEADRAGRPLTEGTWQRLCKMLDVVAATVDQSLRAPRHGDSDDGRALVLGPTTANRWRPLLAFGCATFGAPDWWPKPTPDALSSLLSAMASTHQRRECSALRPAHFHDAGLTILRTTAGADPEIWCRCEGGPHGYLSIAAHAHADALAVEVRQGGIDVLADPGTYCYHGDQRWRSYFRSTLGHNTIELAGRSQSASGGPFLWTRHAGSAIRRLEVGEDGEVAVWSAEHDGYAVLHPPAWHTRTVRLSGSQQRLEIVDEIDSAGDHPLRLAFHLGPRIHVDMNDHVGSLWWSVAGTSADDGNGGERTATLLLPETLRWTLARGWTEPVLGWYSPRFGQKQPASSLLGQALCSGNTRLVTVLQFHSRARV